MANPIKAQDPAAAALSAIEEALNLSDLSEPAVTGEGEATRSAPGFEVSLDDRLNHPLLPPRSLGDTVRPKLPSMDDAKIFGRGPGRPNQTPATQTGALNAPAAPDRGFADVLSETRERQLPDRSPDRLEGAPAVPPANDDKESVGAILRSLQAKSSRTPMLVAGAAAVLWTAVCLFALFADRADLAGGSLLQPKTALVLLAVVGPLLFFFMTAALTRRAQEVRMTARSMLQVAVRLAEPETIATEQMVTLSQAIRREIAAMGDGIERALARAGELETLVRSEVSNIERSFGENERKVRSLIDELSSEREAIVGNAEKVRGAILGAHESLARDLDGVSERLAQTVDEAGGRVTASLSSKGEEIRGALADVGEDCAANLAASGHELVERLRLTTEDVAAALVGQTADFEGKLANASHLLMTDLGQRADDIVHRLDETGTRISEEIVSRGDSLAGRLAETGDRLHAVVTTHGDGLARKPRRDRRAHRHPDRRADGSRPFSAFEGSSERPRRTAGGEPRQGPRPLRAARRRPSSPLRGHGRRRRRPAGLAHRRAAPSLGGDRRRDHRRAR